MRPLSSPVRDHRVLGRTQLIVGAVFVIFAGALNPIEAGFGLLIAMPVTAAILYLAVFRRVSRPLPAGPPPPPPTPRQGTPPLAHARRRRGVVSAPRGSAAAPRAGAPRPPPPPRRPSARTPARSRGGCAGR